MTWAIIIVGIYFLFGIIIIPWVDEHLPDPERFDPEDRFDRGTFRVAVLLWPVALLLLATVNIHDWWESRAPRHSRTIEYFRDGGLSGHYLRWKQRR